MGPMSLKMVSTKSNHKIIIIFAQDLVLVKMQKWPQKCNFGMNMCIPNVWASTKRKRENWCVWSKWKPQHLIFQMIRNYWNSSEMKMKWFNSMGNHNRTQCSIQSMWWLFYSMTHPILIFIIQNLRMQIKHPATSEHQPHDSSIRANHMECV